MRNTIISLYQPSHLAKLIPTMQSHVDSLFQNVSAAREGEDIPFSDLATKMAIDIIGETAFGVQFCLSSHQTPVEDTEVSEFLKLHTDTIESLKMDLNSSFSTVVGLIVPILQTPGREILKRIPGTADFKMHQTNQKLCDRIDEIIAKRSIEGTRDSNDILAVLLHARESGSVGRDLFTHSYIRGLMYEQLLAGTKTSAFTLAMTVYLVSKHPEVEKKLLQEIDSFVPCDAIPTADDLQYKFPYLDQVKYFVIFMQISPNFISQC